jgi:cytochrome P450
MAEALRTANEMVTTTDWKDTMTVPDELLRLPFERPDGLSIAPLTRELQRQCPITRVLTPAGDEAWLALGYDEVKQLFADKRLGLAHPDPSSAARISNAALFGGAASNYDTEDADHARMRGLLLPHFSPKRMREFRPRVEAIVEELLDGLAAQTPPADLHEALSFPLPVLVICELLGVPYDDRAQLREWSDGMADMNDTEHSSASMAALFAYMDELIARKRIEPADDMISSLCAAENGQVDDEYISYLASVTLFAGHETTVTSIDLGILNLLANPEQHLALLEDPSLLAGTVEEILRAGVIAEGWVPRYARTDVEIGGVTVKAGEVILLDPIAADYDERVFAEPDRFDISRKPNAHIAFGYGPRYCTGAPLARIELETVFSRIIPRFPTLKPAIPIETMQVRRGLLTGGFVEVPVTW